jgi:hypothetical protein
VLVEDEQSLDSPVERFLIGHVDIDVAAAG